MMLAWYPGKANVNVLEFPGVTSNGSIIGKPLLDYSGFTGAPSARQSVRSPGQHGATGLETLYDPRKISFGVYLQSASLQELLDAQREIAAAFDVGYGTGALVWQQEDGTEYLINCIADSGCPSSVGSADTRGPQYQKLTFPLLADDPFWYSGVPHSATFTFTTKSFFPFNFPFNFQTSQSSIQSITNSGSHNTPLYVKFTGPITNPVLTNNLTGKSIGLTLAIAAGETVEINTDENDLYAIYNAMGSTELAFQYLTSTTLLREFYLRPGLNPLQLSSSSYGSGAQAYIEWSDKYSAV